MSKVVVVYHPTSRIFQSIPQRVYEEYTRTGVPIPEEDLGLVDPKSFVSLRDIPEGNDDLMDLLPNDIGEVEVELEGSGDVVKYPGWGPMDSKQFDFLLSFVYRKRFKENFLNSKDGGLFTGIRRHFFFIHSMRKKLDPLIEMDPIDLTSKIQEDSNRIKILCDFTVKTLPREQIETVLARRWSKQSLEWAIQFEVMQNYPPFWAEMMQNMFNIYFSAYKPVHIHMRMPNPKPGNTLTFKGDNTSIVIFPPKEMGDVWYFPVSTGTVFPLKKG